MTSLKTFVRSSNQIGAQLSRYLAGGIGVYIVDVLVFFGLVQLLPNSHLIANGIAKLCGAAAGFVLHKHFTYRWKQSNQTWVQMIRYAFLLGFNLLTATGLMFLGIRILVWPAWPVKIISDIIIIITSFLLSRVFVFNRHPSP